MTELSHGTDSTLPRSTGRQILQEIDGFELAWHAGDGPRIEDWLGRWAEGRRGEFLEWLIRIECGLRRRQGDEPALAEYLARFPDWTPEVGRAFRDDSACRPGGSKTEHDSGNHELIPRHRPAEPPDSLGPGDRVAGRYEVRREIGRGGFAVVYEAWDLVLERPVALKMPSVSRFRDDKQLHAFVREARSAAKLYHPGVVQVHDVLQGAGHVTIIQQLIDGPTLSRRMRSGPLSLEQAVDLIIGIAGAVNYAHRHGFVHRDLKPANILLDPLGRPHVADFGLAIHESLRGEHRGELAGTFPYMSPEQVRGEAHRLDGRSDIWSLGVLFYELLTQRRPFGGEPVSRLFEEIQHREPIPPRQVDPALPRELARICLKCLAKQATARYETAADLAEDLSHWRQGTTASARPPHLGPDSALGGRPAPLRIVPKGLRSFDAADAEFFLQLIPGPRDRDGLPDSLRVWKRQAESTDPDEAFPLGLMYGPSGCGKSSLIKAGLLPILAPHVDPIYIEASAAGTEDRLIRALARRIPGLRSDADLAEVLAGVRRGGGIGGRKVLLVLDQFEQWLHARPDRPDEPLVRALRQCDGTALQGILLVRDDFWMSVTRFLRRLEIPQVEGRNSIGVDLFDAEHARRVLLAFGAAYGKIPESGPGHEAEAFVSQAVAGLARDGRVVSARLALFAEMMKGRPWTPAALVEAGGTEGIGVRFLEEAFGSRSAAPGRRLLGPAAREVLGALLPDLGTEIKSIRPESHLRALAGLARPDEFSRLLEMLDGELRLITPAEGDCPAEDSHAERHFQLTHDDLVPALREWLTLGKKQTRHGRSELVLAERTALWTARPERKQLPTWAEWLAILAWSDRRAWTAPRLRMMRAATRHHFQRTALAALAAGALLAAGAAGKLALQEAERSRRVVARLEQLWSVAPRHLPALLDAMEPDSALWRSEAERVAADSEAPAEERARAALALARLGSPPVGILCAYLANATPEDQRPALEELRPSGPRLAPGLWAAARDDRLNGDPLLSVAAALAAFDPASPGWDALAPRVAGALVEADPLAVMPRVEQLTPVRGALKEVLLAQFGSHPEGDRRRLLAASILARYAAADPGLLSVAELVGLALKADSAQLSVLDPILLARRAEVAGPLEQQVGLRIPLSATPASEDASSRQANAAQVLLRLGRADLFWPRLAQSSDPRLRTRLIDRLEPSGVGWEEILSRLAAETEPTIRQAIVLGLDPFLPRLPAESRTPLIDELFRLHRTDPDGGVHTAAEWLLGRWADRARLDRQLALLVGPPIPGRDWFLTPHGHTMLIVRPRGEFVVGSPEDEPWRDVNETRRVESIDYPIAVSAHEITIDQYLAFRPDHNYDRAVMPSPSSPAGSVSWFDSVAYCRWLSEQDWAGVEPGQIPYPPADLIRPGMSLDDDYLRRDGYRLPTALEWEYLARSRAATSRFFGNSDDHLARFAWFGSNSGEHPHPVGLLRPSPDGLFDLYGNLIEWCDPGSAGPCSDRQSNRGGNFRSTPRFLRASMPNIAEATDPFSFNGFRIVRPIRLP